MEVRGQRGDAAERPDATEVRPVAPTAERPGATKVSPPASAVERPRATRASPAAPTARGGRATKGDAGEARGSGVKGRWRRCPRLRRWRRSPRPAAPAARGDGGDALINISPWPGNHLASPDGAGGEAGGRGDGAAAVVGVRGRRGQKP